jgi:hypothetical protein
MNYKTLIAFLGKNQMKDWVTPKSDWIIIKEYTDGNWTNEFKEIIKDHKILDKLIVMRISYVELGVNYLGTGPYLVIIEDGGIDPHDKFRYYYNKNIDMVFYLKKEEYDELEQDGLIQKILDYIEHVGPDVSGTRDVFLKDIT